MTKVFLINNQKEAAGLEPATENRNVTLISLEEGNTRKGHAPLVYGLNEPSVAAICALRYVRIYDPAAIKHRHFDASLMHFTTLISPSAKQG
jgi:hypothetical protein